MEFEEVFIDVPWGKIAALCYGQKDWPIVLMVHGNQDSAGTFLPLVEYFPKKFRLIIPEMPSSGHSSPFPPGRPLQVLDFVSPLKFVVDHFGIDQFTYIGHSMGVQIGLLFNAVYPNYITKLICLDSVSYPAVEPDIFANWFKWTYENYYDENNYNKFNSRPTSNPSYTYEKALAHVRKTRGLTESAGKAVLKRSLIPAGNGLYSFCWDQRLKLLNIPLFSIQYQLALFGSMKMPHLTILASESVKMKMKSVKLHLIEEHFVNNSNYRLVMVDGNHDVHLNDPEGVAKHVVPFLNGQDADKEITARFVHQYRNMWNDIQTKSKL
ncbi:serine hydrolase-like protein [Arctopsyche grandis]|uniref:serine hydrolase-like protein n=1 Tax=Arctopsyche grandis TaxID=121162 RepID=UPI00406D69BD